jgi:hypothetical protein
MVVVLELEAMRQKRRLIAYRVVKPEAILYCRETAVASFLKLRYSSMDVVNSLLRLTKVRTSKGEGEGRSSK